MTSLPFRYDPPAHTGLEILYRDDHLIVANKPAGLLSVPGRDDDKQDCMIHRIQNDFPTARIVHRLDMATSGAMVMALSDEVQRQLSIQFQKRLVSKRYEAVVAGQVLHETGEIDLPLITDWPNRPKQKVDYLRGKPSLTRFRVLSRDPVQDSTYLQLVPVTGRTHQLRVHLMQIGHPVLGDRLYASEEITGRSRRLMLHSTCLSFRHPVTGASLELVSAAPF